MRKIAITIMIVLLTLSGCSSRIIEVRQEGDRILSCRQLRAEIAAAKHYGDENRRKAGIRTGAAEATDITSTVVQGSSFYIPIPGLGAIITAFLSLFRRGLTPKKAQKAIAAGDARIAHLSAIADLRDCKFLQQQQQQ